MSDTNQEERKLTQNVVRETVVRIRQYLKGTSRTKQSDLEAEYVIKSLKHSIVAAVASLTQNQAFLLHLETLISKGNNTNTAYDYYGSKFVEESFKSLDGKDTSGDSITNIVISGSVPCPGFSTVSHHTSKPDTSKAKERLGTSSRKSSSKSNVKEPKHSKVPSPSTSKCHSISEESKIIKKYKTTRSRRVPANNDGLLSSIEKIWGIAVRKPGTRCLSIKAKDQDDEEEGDEDSGLYEFFSLSSDEESYKPGSDKSSVGSTTSSDSDSSNESVISAIKVGGKSCNSHDGLSEKSIHGCKKPSMTVKSSGGLSQTNHGSAEQTRGCAESSRDPTKSRGGSESSSGSVKLSSGSGKSSHGSSKSSSRSGGSADSRHGSMKSSSGSAELSCGSGKSSSGSSKASSRSDKSSRVSDRSGSHKTTSGSCISSDGSHKARDGSHKTHKHSSGSRKSSDESHKAGNESVKTSSGTHKYSDRSHKLNKGPHKSNTAENSSATSSHKSSKTKTASSKSSTKSSKLNLHHTTDEEPIIEQTRVSSTSTPIYKRKEPEPYNCDQDAHDNLMKEPQSPSHMTSQRVIRKLFYNNSRDGIAVDSPPRQVNTPMPKRRLPDQYLFESSAQLFEADSILDETQVPAPPPKRPKLYEMALDTAKNISIILNSRAKSCSL